MSSHRAASRGAGALAGAVALVVLVAAALVALVPLSPPAARGEDAPADVFSAARATSRLQSLARAPRPVGTAENARVGDALLAELRALGLETVEQRRTVVRARGDDAVQAIRLRNVAARLGDGGPAVLLAAHYDTVPTSPGAADDGAGVAALLEAARIFTAGPPPASDLIFLFTDSEETGLTGARAFAGHPWMEDVAAVLNFEARGTRGPSVLFETARGSTSLMRLAAGAPHPLAYSYATEVYRRLPNSTDFEVLRDSGAAGLNFAFFAGADGYHTSLDDLGRLDLRSLQHQGSYAVGVGRRLAALGDDGLRALPADGDAVYFTLPPHLLAVYPGALNLPLALLALFLAAAASVLAVRRGRAGAGRVTAALLALPALALVVSAAGVWLLHAAADALVGVDPDLLGDGNALLAAWSCAAAALTATVILVLGRRLGTVAAGCGVALAWALLAVVTAVTVPGGSYLFAWPALSLAVAMVGLATAPAPGWPGWGRFAVLLVALVPAVLLWMPLLALLGVALGVAGAHLPLTIVTALATLLLAPLLLLLVGDGRRWPLPAAAGALALLLAAVALAGAGHDAARPQPDSLFYALDAASGEALWASWNRRPDVWTAPYLGDDAERRELAPGFVPDGWTALAAAGPTLPLPPPRVELLTDGPAAEAGWSFELRAASPRGAPWLRLLLTCEAGVRAVSVEGERVAFDGDDAPTRVEALLRGSPGGGFRVAVETGAEAPLTVTAVDRSYALPELGDGPVPPRPPELRPLGRAPTDVTMVRDEMRFAPGAAAAAGSGERAGDLSRSRQPAPQQEGSAPHPS